MKGREGMYATLTVNRRTGGAASELTTTHERAQDAYTDTHEHSHTG